MEAPLNDPVNIGNPHEMTLLDLAKRIIPLTRSEIVFRPFPVDDPKVRQPDIGRARALLGMGGACGDRRRIAAHRRRVPGEAARRTIRTVSMECNSFRLDRQRFTPRSPSPNESRLTPCQGCTGCRRSQRAARSPSARKRDARHLSPHFRLRGSIGHNRSSPAENSGSLGSRWCSGHHPVGNAESGRLLDLMTD